MPPSPTIEVYLTDWNDEASVQLRAAQRAEIEHIYGRQPGPPPSAEEVPVFIVLKVNSVPGACGGLKPLPSQRCEHGQTSQAAEIKRMFVLPEYRGAAGKLGEDSKAEKVSLASLLLRELEAQAVLRDWDMLKLGTGVGMTPARSFYERIGFYRIPLFGHYVSAPASVCYGKVLYCGLSASG